MDCAGWVLGKTHSPCSKCGRFSSGRVAPMLFYPWCTHHGEPHPKGAAEVWQQKLLQYTQKAETKQKITDQKKTYNQKKDWLIKVSVKKPDIIKTNRTEPFVWQWCWRAEWWLQQLKTPKSGLGKKSFSELKLQIKRISTRSTAWIRYRLGSVPGGQFPAPL